MRNPFKRKKKKATRKPARRGIPTADEVPRIASTVTTLLPDGTPAPKPEPAPEPEPILIKGPEAKPALPGPDVLRVHTDEIDAKFANKSPEELCKVDPAMSIDEMRARLAKLFTRHNRAASSFDLRRRAEAEIMLQAIVTVREKYIEKL
jgi:hypothetical protein